MSSLASIHLGEHTQLTTLPSFNGLTNLKAMVLAVLVRVAVVPSFAPLERLQRLTVVALASVEKWPDMAPFEKKLIQFQFAAVNIVCCNGFLRGDCDLTHPFCQANPGFNLSAPMCVTPNEEHATASTLAAFTRFSSSVCQIQAPNVERVLRSNIEQCGGVRWRQCVPVGSENGTLGVCANLRMQVLYCSADQSVIELRKQQILHGIGQVCDPLIEDWLGCKRQRY